MENSLQRENEPLISNKHISDKTSNYKRIWIFTSIGLLIVVAIVLIFGFFHDKGIFEITTTSYDIKNDNQNDALANSKDSEGSKMKNFKGSKEIDWSFDPSVLDNIEGASLPDKNFIRVKVSALDPGHLEGTYIWDDRTETTFKFDVMKRYVHFSQKNVKTNEVYEFYSEEDSVNKKHIYRFNDREIDATQQDEAITHFNSLYESQLAADIVMTSVKLGAKGLVGGSSGGVQMLHNLAMHLYRTSKVKDMLPSTFENNRKLVNLYVASIDEDAEETQDTEENEESTSTETEDDPVFTSSVDISQQWCLFWCDGNAVDGDPSYCYSQAHCKTEVKCDNDCFGLCGDGCDCWAWVCGDCACHCLCENHDYYCSCESMSSVECWGFWEFIWEDCD